jgi:transcriptional regulator with XRE-family HTH domain
MTDFDLNARFGVNLRRLRLMNGLSQEALANVCDVHRAYIGAVERGERNVTLHTIEKLATALEVDPLELLREPER